ncbi:hypothetical protein GQ53DRAFT_825456 [Thozetella sp. PMI_491]|nr:hypothetical protein GQ53DRAFT_825456 [Thozetella sp. PMI_491]
MAFNGSQTSCNNALHFFRMVINRDTIFLRRTRDFSCLHAHLSSQLTRRNTANYCSKQEGPEMEPRHHFHLTQPPNSPSEFIYDVKSRSTTPSAPFAVKKLGVGVYSRSPARQQRLDRHVDSSHSAFVSSYPAPGFAEPWNPTLRDQTERPPMTDQDRAGAHFPRSPAPITFREPCWDGTRFRAGAGSLKDPLNPRVVELDEDEDEPEVCAGLSSFGVNARTRDDSISPKTIPKSMPVAVHDDVPPRGQEPEESWFEARAYGTPSTIASAPSMQTKLAATLAHSPSPALATFLPQSSHSQRVPEGLFHHPRPAPTIVSLSDEDAATEAMSSTGSWAPTEGEDYSGDGGSGGGIPSFRFIVSPDKARHAVEIAEAAEDIGLAATKAHLRAHIANFRARACTSHMEHGHRRHGSVIDHTQDNDDDILLGAKTPCSKTHLPMRRRGRCTRSRSRPYRTTPAASKKRQDDSSSTLTCNTPAPFARSPSPSVSVHVGIFSVANESDVPGLPCTDSLLANTSAICNLMWEKAVRNRLLSLNAEIRAVSTMRDLLEAAETLVFDTGVLRHAALSAGSGVDPAQHHEEMASDGLSERAVEVLLVRVVSSAKKICEILAYGTGVLALEELEHSDW